MCIYIYTYVKATRVATRSALNGLAQSRKMATLPKCAVVPIGPVTRVKKKTPLWAGYHDSRSCSRVTYPESYVNQYTSMRLS